jgi:hypothetical protein
MELKKSSGLVTSNTTGEYVIVNFKFTQATLDLFNSQIVKAETSRKDQIIEQASEEEKDKEEKANKEAILNYKPKIYFGGSLDSLSAQQFLSFMYNNQYRDFDYVKANLNFDGVDWQSMIDNSLTERRIKDDFGLPVTKFGKSLLQVCIDNEDSRDPPRRQKNYHWSVSTS